MSLIIGVLIFSGGSADQITGKVIGSLLSVYLWFRFIYPELASMVKNNYVEGHMIYFELAIVILSFVFASLVDFFTHEELQIGILIICMFLTPTLLTGIYSLYEWSGFGAVMGMELFVLRIHGAVFLGMGSYMVKELI